MKLTTRAIETLSLPAGKSDCIVFDDDVAGFGIRLRPSGSKNWIYQYRIGTKQRRMLLGSVTAVPLPLARKNAGELEARVRLGQDPALDKENAKRASADTFGALGDKYLEARKPELRPRSYKEVARHLTKHCKPLQGQPVTAISQRAVADLLRKLVQEAGDVTANRVRASLHALFTWVLKEGIRLPEGNIIAHTHKRDEKSRDRVLSLPELKAIWDACRDDDYGDILRLLILTGQRANEIAALRWDEVHDEMIVLPGERTKNHRAHVVPLSSRAKAILEKRGRDRAFVFGRDDTGWQGWGAAKHRIEARIGAGITERWTPHDIRRSVVTHMAERVGVLPHIIEAVVNHQSGHKGGIAGVYNKSTYDREKREALNLWAEHLLAFIEGRDAAVVPLKRA